MESTALLELEDQGMSRLLEIQDIIDDMIARHIRGDVATDVETDVVVSDTNATPHLTSEGVDSGTHVAGIHPEPAPFDLAAQTDALESQISMLMSSYDVLRQKLKQGGAPLTPHITTGTQPTDSHHFHSPHTITDTQPIHTHQFHSSHLRMPPHSPSDQHSTHRAESMIALKDLPFLQKKEFKIHGGQIGDIASDITYSNISKQIDQGLREMHTESEIIRAVFRTIKPSNFKDMLSSKDDMTIAELKSFLHSHLGEKSSTELFQELINAKQHEHETPQQFLYRMMGLKQKVIFMSKQTLISSMNHKRHRMSSFAQSIRASAKSMMTSGES